MINQFIIFLIFINSICSFSQELKINEYNKYNINGVEHSVFIKGQNVSNPLLIILHGGPGLSDFYFWQTHNKKLEEKYTVVTYDQRGSGLSYNDSISKNSLTFSQLENDALKLINLIKTRFKKDKVFLIGHSAGSITGINLVKNNPKLFSAFISIGQVVNGYSNEKISLEYSLSKAIANKDTIAINELKDLKSRYPNQNKKNSLSDLYLSRKWLRKFNGDLCQGTTMNGLYVNMDPTAKKYYNEKLISKGESFSMVSMWDEVMKIDLFKSVTKIDVPIYFIAGRCDYNTPSILTYKYYRKIKAPIKKFIWFENSGHYTPFTEPDNFNDLLMNEILMNNK